MDTLAVAFGLRPFLCAMIALDRWSKMYMIVVTRKGCKMEMFTATVFHCLLGASIVESATIKNPADGTQQGLKLRPGA
jgi:hypothetical protein